MERILSSKRFVLGLALFIILVISVSCGGGKRSSSITPPPPNTNNQTNNNTTDTTGGIDPITKQIATQAGQVGGFIRDAAGNPVVGIEVMLDQDPISAQTAADGSFLILEATPGAHQLRIGKDGYEVETFDVTVNTGTPTNVDLVSGLGLKYISELGGGPTGVLRGKTTDLAENPVPDVGILVFNEAGYFRFTHSNAEGGYVFEGLPAGQYAVLAFKPGFKIFFGHTAVEAGQTTVFNIRLEPFSEFGSVAGIVTDEEERPLPLTAVFLMYRKEGGNNPNFATFTDEKGHYLFEKVPAGPAEMTAFKPGFYPEHRSIIVPAGQTLVQNFRLRRFQEEPHFGSIRGHVTNLEGQPLFEARISLFREQGTEPRVTWTNQEGFYIFKEVPFRELPYGLLAEKQGYNPADASVIVGPDNPEPVVDFVLEAKPNGEGAVLKGLVVGPEERGIPGAHVTLWQPGQDPNGGPVLKYETFTNELGRFVIEGIVPGGYLLKVAKEGFKIYQQEIQFGPGEVKEVVIHLLPIEQYNAILEGKIYDEQHQPIAGANIRLYRILQGGELEFKYETASHEDGTYRIEGIIPGYYLLEVKKEGFITFKDDLFFQSGEKKVLDVILKHSNAPAILRGHVINPLEEGIPEAKVELWGNDPNMQQPRYQTFTGQDGKFAIEGIVPGYYLLKVTKPGFLPFEEKIFLGPGQEMWKVIVLHPEQPQEKASLHVRVWTQDQQPVAGAFVALYLQEMKIYWATTNENGEAFIDGINPGVYKLRVTKDGFLPWEQMVEFRPGETLFKEVILTRNDTTPAYLFGTVTNGEGMPINEAKVELCQSGAVKYTAWTGPEGNYDIRGIVPGAYGMKVTKPGYIPYNAEVGFLPGEEKRIDVVLFAEENPAPARLHGRVHNMEQQGVPEAHVALWQPADPNGGGWVKKYETWTNGDGFYVIEGINAGVYKMTVDAQGYQHFEEMIELPSGSDTEKWVLLEFAG